MGTGGPVTCAGRALYLLIIKSKISGDRDITGVVRCGRSEERSDGLCDSLQLSHSPLLSLGTVPPALCVVENFHHTGMKITSVKTNHSNHRQLDKEDAIQLLV